MAVEVERLLVAAGRPAYLLDGDNLRQGLNGDLGFSADDRAENVRRVGEVARLFADAGVVALVPVISPYARRPRSGPRDPRHGRCARSPRSSSTRPSRSASSATPRASTPRPGPARSPASPASTTPTRRRSHPSCASTPDDGDPADAGRDGARPAGRAAPVRVTESPVAASAPRRPWPGVVVTDPRRHGCVPPRPSDDHRARPPGRRRAGHLHR